MYIKKLAKQTKLICYWSFGGIKNYVESCIKNNWEVSNSVFKPTKHRVNINKITKQIKPIYYWIHEKKNGYIKWKSHSSPKQKITKTFYGKELVFWFLSVPATDFIDRYCFQKNC